MDDQKEDEVGERRPEDPSQEMPPMRPFGPEILPVKDIVGRLEELVRYVLECEAKPMKEDVSFVEVYKQLVDIRNAINVLSADQQAMLSVLESAGITREQMNAGLSVEDKKIVSKLQGLEGICEAAKERLHRSLQRSPEAEREIQDKIRRETTTKKQKIVHRKGKFRPLGGKAGWLPT